MSFAADYHYFSEDQLIQGVDVYLNRINDNFEGFQDLIAFHCEFQDVGETYPEGIFAITISLQEWFSAGMSAPLGAILDILEKNSCIVEFNQIDKAIEIILCKNKFLENYGYSPISDNNFTTLPFARIPILEIDTFKSIILELWERKELRHISKESQNMIDANLSEIFVNSREHSDSEYVYICGQFLPANRELSIMIADSGIGIKESIRQKLLKNYPSEEIEKKLTGIKAINWALKRMKTTRESNRGGLGLYNLKESLSKTGHNLRIISNDGFFELKDAYRPFRTFKGSFPGTIVNLIFQT